MFSAGTGLKFSPSIVTVFPAVAAFGANAVIRGTAPWAETITAESSGIASSTMAEETFGFRVFISKSPASD
jgi:hypothetical protein